MAWSSATVSIGAATKKADYDRLLNNIVHVKSEAAEFDGNKTFNDDVAIVGDLTVGGAGIIYNGSYETDSANGDTLFDLLDALIPDEGDSIPITGGAATSTGGDLGNADFICTFNRAYRHNATTIYLYFIGLYISATSTFTIMRGSITIVNGNAGFDVTGESWGPDKVSVSW